MYPPTRREVRQKRRSLDVHFERDERAYAQRGQMPLVRKSLARRKATYYLGRLPHMRSRALVQVAVESVSRLRDGKTRL